MPRVVHRIEVRPREGRADPAGEAVRRDAAVSGLPGTPERIDCAHVYLVEGELEPADVRRLADELLADPVSEEATIGAAPARADALIEVHPLPGVMDPDGEAIELAVRTLLDRPVVVRTGRRYDVHGLDDDAAGTLAGRCLANPVIHAIHRAPYHPEVFPAGRSRPLEVAEVPILDLDDAALGKLSRETHLFLSPEEMRAIQDAYRQLGREPREIELETLAQTWSEHCVHKTLKSTIRFRALPAGPDADRPGHEDHGDGSTTIHNLLKSTVAAATTRLIDEGIDWCLSVFVDNAGIIAFDDEHAVCFKCETHNHPSAIEPYGGAATGIGGCIRDIIGTGLAARPIAATDVFCVARPDRWTHADLPAGCLHPRRILGQVVAGVRDYGNRMGIPTLNGTVWFDDDYIGNPLVYCGCIGVMPRDKVTGAPQSGDRIIALGGRTGRDGIHGATFSSAELTDSHADEFSHAVQIGNPVTEKKLLDAILEARDHAGGCLFRAITDCGAGGFSSAVGEMGEELGAEVDLERAPLKYDGLSPTEIWISEAQERMVLAVTSENLETLAAICQLHDVEWCDLGRFGTDGSELILRYDGTEVGRLPMAFLHGGLPVTTREAAWEPPKPSVPRGAAAPPETAGETLIALLAHPNIASKHWIIRQYDHEVQGRSVLTPLVGPRGEGPGDAAVIQPVPDSPRSLAIANGLATGLRDDPYRMALAAIDECVRNLVCVGTDPDRIAILDNFCWPGCDDPQRLGSLVLAAEGCHDGALAYRVPFISGKDSLNNQFAADDGRTFRIPPTLLISGFGLVPDGVTPVSMDAKSAGNTLVLVGETTAAMGGTHHAMLYADRAADRSLPEVDLQRGPATARVVHTLIRHGLVRAAHDCSEGGLLVAAAEMCIAGDLGLQLDDLAHDDARAACFAETPSRYLLEIAPADLQSARTHLAGTPHTVVGTFNDTRRLTCPTLGTDLAVESLRAASRTPLDW